MLVLTRKSDQSIVIGNDIEVKILEIRGDQVSIGFSAPKDVTIYRKEVFDAIHEENLQAASNSKEDLMDISSVLEQHLAPGRSGSQRASARLSE